MRRQGFTLPELLISIAILSILSIYLTQMLTQQNQAYTVVDQVTEVQNNMRAIASLLERETRVTGMLAPEGAAVCGQDNTNGPDIYYVTDNQALTFANEVRYDLGAEITSGTPGTGSNVTLTLAEMTLDGAPFYDNTGDAVGDSDFVAGAGVIVADRNNPGRGVMCGVIRADVPNGVDPAVIPGPPGLLRVDFSLGGGALSSPLPGSPVAQLVAVPAHVYQVNGTNQLVRNGVVLAEDVEDLQFALFYDRDGNGSVTSEALEYPGSDAGTQYQSGSWDNEDLREIRFNVVVRARAADPKLQNAEFQATENRAPVAGTDGFRRRVYSSAVRPRNVGHRFDG